MLAEYGAFLDRSSAAFDESVGLYRAVSTAELEDIKAYGGFRPGLGTMETKLFGTSRADAHWWGQQLHGSGNYHIVSVLIPYSYYQGLYRTTTDGRAVVAVDYDQLADFNSRARIHMP